MKTKTNLKAGVLCRYCSSNHNQGLKVRTRINAGATLNHNQAVKVKSKVKAGAIEPNHNQGMKVNAALQLKTNV